MTDPDYLPVTAAVIERNGRILIARRKHPFMGHGWEFPGGKLEENETLEECLKREIREELGIDITVGALISSRKHVLNCQSAIILGPPDMSREMSHRHTVQCKPSRSPSIHIPTLLQS